MPQNLVIVESPAKVRTLKKFLGPEYDVRASVGHVRDLPKSKLGVDIEDNYKPQYRQSADKASVIKDLKKAASSVDRVYLATDPDREGEAISWHLEEILGIPNDEPVRIQFNEITERAVKEAIKNPRPIDMGLVDAQQARRILDRLVGYMLSPFLWKKVRRGLSAGRVQSAALNLICEREAEIEAFVPKEFWTIDASLEKGSGEAFTARYFKGKTSKIEDAELASKVVRDCQAAPFTVSKVEVKASAKRPSAPFITSTLQQEAYRKLGFTARTTMSLAQQLYEGMEIQGKGHVALITYMRTDSYRIAEEAKTAAKEYVERTYGKEYCPAKSRIYTKKANSQDAHEAIRPVRLDMPPESVKDLLSRDQYRLYKLIWNRFLASQMSDMKLDLTYITVESAGHTFKAQGSKVTFNGYSVVYGNITNGDEKEEDQQSIPQLSEGEILKLIQLKSLQQFTEPPARFTEGSLIKALEEKGVGRPSTYASIIDTIKKRDYVDIKERTFVPTSVGRTVCDVLKSNFQDIVSIDFTADM
ncbi:MAG TPA: type I DNA topoisomerase, partial [Bacillota bacterium]|nr:type I DNA topoisomerase [Bacillota bacterium]